MRTKEEIEKFIKENDTTSDFRSFFTISEKLSLELLLDIRELLLEMNERPNPNIYTSERYFT